MAVSIVFRLSGGAGNTSAIASTGGVMSTSTAVPTTLNGLFDQVSSGEASSGDTEYRCIYVLNTGTTTAENARIWIQTNTADTEMAIALDGNGKNADAETEVDESTAPSGESFTTAATSYATGLELGNLAQNDRYAVWIRRTIGVGAAGSAGKSYVFRVQYDYVP
jgi:hypothetical protein